MKALKGLYQTLKYVTELLKYLIFFFLRPYIPITNDILMSISAH